MRFVLMIGLALLSSMTVNEFTRAGSMSQKPVETENEVTLELQISGVDGEGWSIQISPATAASQFKTYTKKLKPSQRGSVQLKNIAIKAKSITPDRDCAFAIKITDSEGDSEVFKRSIRLKESGKDDPLPELSKTFFLRTTVVARKDDPRDR